MGVEEVIDAWGLGRYQKYLLVLCCGGYMSICAEIMVLIMSGPSLTDSFHHVSKMDFATLLSLTAVASSLSGIIVGYLAGMYGRRIPFILSSATVALFGFLSSFSVNFWMYVGLRIIVSIGNGGLSSIDHLLFNESIPAANRGKYTILVTVCGAAGILFIATISLFEYPFPLWRVISFSASIPMTLIFIFRLWISEESVRFLYISGDMKRYQETVNRITKFNLGVENDDDDQSDYSPLASLKNPSAEVPPPINASEDVSPAQRFFKFWTSTDRRSFVGLTIAWSCLGVSYWGLTSFLPEFLIQASVPANFTLFLMVLCEFPGLFLAIGMIEIWPLCGGISFFSAKCGRLFTLRFFSGCASFFSFFCAIIVITGPPSLLIIACCLVYMFLIPIWAILFVYTPENFPTTQRGFAMGWMLFVSGLTSIFSPFLSASLLTLPLYVYMLFWGGFLLVLFGVSCILRKETASIPLSSLDQEEQQRDEIKDFD